MTSPKEIMAKVKISRKNFHRVISKLENIGLLRLGEDNTIQPTLLGRIILNEISTLYTATNVYMKPRTIDAVELSGVQTKADMDNLIDSLIEDDTIKSILKKMTVGKTKI